MTRRPYPAHRYSSNASREKCDQLDPPVVSSVGELIAAVPALLGFVPERSMVLVCMRSGLSGTTVEVCMRQDLPPRLDSPELAEVIHRCGEVCEREGFDAVIAVLITGSRFVMPYEVLADALAGTLLPLGIDLLGVHHVAHLTAGTTWTSLGGDSRAGTLEEPSASQVAASRVMSGRQIRASRNELTELLALAPAAECARFEVSRDSVELECEVKAPAELLYDTVEDLISVNETGDLDHLTAARTMFAIGTTAVRDALLALASTDLGPVTEQVWVHLTTRVMGPDRAHPATMLAVWSYLRGEGPLAGVALEIALDADPSYRLALLLDTALQNGVRPTVVRELVLSARELANDFGVDLPPDVER
ncbi:MAG: DUF4192 domain-containing protein [Rhodococcus sp. (in: high G+C Gram-positive bacteria)]